jgi:hypothetical protein
MRRPRPVREAPWGISHRNRNRTSSRLTYSSPGRPPKPFPRRRFLPRSAASNVPPPNNKPIFGKVASVVKTPGDVLLIVPDSAWCPTRTDTTSSVVETGSRSDRAHANGRNSSRSGESAKWLHRKRAGRIEIHTRPSTHASPPGRSRTARRGWRSTQVRTSRRVFV